MTMAFAVAVTGCASGGAPASEPSAGNQSSSGETVKVRVAAASDLQFALEEVADAMAEKHPEIELAVSYGSSGTFFQQLTNGAPFDVYLSADLSYPQQLAEAGLADPGDVFEYAVGRLVVWATNSSPVDPTVGLSALTTPEAKRVAIGDPAHAPYGAAAVAAMKTAGIYEEVKDKFVLGESISQAAEFARTGNAQVGVIALSLAMAPEMADEGRWSEVPLDSFPELRQGGVVLGSAADPAAARTFRDFLISDEGRAILKSYGFYEPGQ